MKNLKKLCSPFFPTISRKEQAQDRRNGSSRFTTMKTALGSSCQLALLGIFLMIGFQASAIQYCDYSMTASGRTITISMEQPTTNNYKITIKSAEVMTGIHDGWYMNISGVGNVQVKNYAVLSGDAKRIDINFTSTTTPTLYTAIHVLFPPTTGADLALYSVPPSITWGVCQTTPIITTTAATSVGPNGATLNGNIASNSGSNITSYGFYWSTTNGFADGAGTQVVLGTTDFTGNISHGLTGLSTSTNYYYKAYATNSSGTSYGTQVAFTTTVASPPPTLTTPTATSITHNSAVLGANITSIGGSAITARGTSYKTTTPVAASDNQLADGSTASGVYTQARTGLSPQTRYYHVGFATNSTGTAISPEGNFRTLSNPPTAQPATFTATAAIGSLNVNWGTATFPASGATRAGYLVIYSTGTPSLTSANGVAPAASGTIVNINSALPAQPATTTTISSLAGGTTYNLLIVPYTWDGTNAATYNYLTSGAKTTSGTPMSVPAAPVPPARNASDVVAVYNDGPYSISVTGVSMGGSNVLLAPGNNARLYTSVGNGTTAFAATTAAASMAYLHIDIFSTNANASQVKIELSGANGGMVSGNQLTPNNTWTSLDIPVSTFAAIQGFNSVSFIGIQPYAGAGTFYMDNVYFWKSPPELVDAVVTNFSDITKVFGDPAFQLNASSTNTAPKVYSSSNTLVATISGNTVTVVGVGTSTITLTQAATSTHNAVNTSITLTVTAPPLSTPAPTPPARNAWDVVSVYSNAYSNVTPVSWSADATVEDVQLQGNDTKKISNFTIENVEFGAQNLTAMTMMHLDVYSDDCSLINFWLLNNGDRVAQRSITLSQWNSIEIPLSAYAALGLNLNGVHLLKFESVSGPNKTIYVDNVYFYRPATLLPPTITNFSIPTKAYNDPDFVIPPPTSNSAGAFSYTSSNTNVAQIVNGNMIDIIGGGVTTITATQAADGSYGPGEITAQFTVTFPLPGPSPIPPARTPDRVISLFTGNPPVYANAITPVQAAWSPSVVMTEIPNGTNTALRLDNFGFLGLIDVAEVRFDVSGMSHLHLDIYLNEPLNANPVLSRVNVYLLANGDYLYLASNLVAGWNSLSIPMSNFAAADLTQAWGLKLESINPATQIYIDNVYFSNECYTYYADADNDGFGNPAVSTTVCDGSGIPTGFVNNSDDCDDNLVRYADADNDGFGSATVKVACGGVTNNTDCNDNQLQYADLDGDGFGSGTLVACGVSNNTDCDDGTIRYADNDNDGFGSTTMVACGGVTNSSDCDDNTVRYLDADSDGYGSLVKVACGGVTNSTDCDDTKPTVNPGAAEIPYNLIDDDCDGLIDEGFPPKNTTVTGPQCNTTLPSIDAQVIADVVAGAQGYQWRVTTLTGPNAGLVQFLNTPLRVMKLVQLSNFAYATTYKIEVAVYYAGYLQPYLASNCTVTTPAATTSLANCNQTIASMQDVIYANNVPYASGYKFRVTEVGASGNTQELVRSVREFRMTLITAFQPKFNKAYTVEVSVKNTNGLYLPYGSPCTVTTPLFPTTSIEDSQCEDFAPVTTGTPIYAVSYPGAIAYVFNLTGPGLPAQGIEITRATRSFKLSDFTGLFPSATYSVRVRLVFNANDPAGPYGKVCTVIVPGASRIAALPFAAKAYPNPFGDTFGISVTGSPQKEIGVKLYDMTGRLLEQRRVKVSELDALAIGANLPSGVYNVVVSQGDEVKTLRVVKR